MKNSRPIAARSFTLVELLVTITILGLVAGLTVPLVNRAMESSRRGICASNLRDLARGVLAWSAENNGELPYYGPDPWFLTIGEQIGFKYEGWPTWQSWIDSEGKTPALPKILFCPTAKRSDPKQVLPGFDIAYGINLSLVGHAETGKPRQRLVNVPKPSTVILLADSQCPTENVNNGHGWSVNNDGNPYRKFSRRHKAGANICWLDGHVTFENNARLDEFAKEPWPYGPSWNPQP